MISIFNFTDYRQFIRKRFLDMPKRGYGQAHKLAIFLDVHTTLISQVLKGLKSFTMEQASLTADFLGLTEIESEFFLLLVQMDRAGNESLRKNIRRQMGNIRKKSLDLENRLQAETKLSEEKRAIFYSNWSYSAVRQMTSIKGFDTPESIAEYLNLNKKQTSQIIEFLISSGLCIENNKKLRVGPRSTHLESSSPWASVHHMNWRQKAIQSFTTSDEAKLMYTAPMTLSRKDAAKIREIFVQVLQQIDSIVDPSQSEELHCLNIDWFKIGK